MQRKEGNAAFFKNLYNSQRKENSAVIYSRGKDSGNAFVCFFPKEEATFEKVMLKERN